MAGEPTPPDWLELEADEHVLLRASPSDNLVLASLVAGVTAMLVMAVVVGFLVSRTTGRRVAFVSLLAIVAVIGLAFLVTKRREYVLTNRRVCTAVGLTDKHLTERPLAAVTDVRVEQATWQQLFDVGTVRFATDEGAVTFDLIENPVAVQGQILGVVDLAGGE